MSEITESKREKILHQVRTLLDIADRETTPAGEAASARAKAEEFMRKYRIEEEAALAVDPTVIEPEWRVFDLADYSSPFLQSYLDLFHVLASWNGVRARYYYAEDKLCANAVGYVFDLRVVNLMFTSARMVFSEHLEPKVNPELSDAENCYRLRRAGIERNRVANLLWGASMGSDGAAFHGKVAKLYKAECERRGEQPALSGRGIPADTYRTAYARSFVSRLRTRLVQASDAVDKSSGAVQLHGRSERVEEAFYTRYPEYRPNPTTDDQPRSCDACRKSKHESGHCRVHRITAADRERYRRNYTSTAARAGIAAGREAADAVRLDGSEPTRRLDDRTGEERATTRAVQGVLGN